MDITISILVDMLVGVVSSWIFYMLLSRKHNIDNVYLEICAALNCLDGMLYGLKNAQSTRSSYNKESGFKESKVLRLYGDKPNVSHLGSSEKYILSPILRRRIIGFYNDDVSQNHFRSMFAHLKTIRCYQIMDDTEKSILSREDIGWGIWGDIFFTEFLYDLARTIINGYNDCDNKHFESKNNNDNDTLLKVYKGNLDIIALVIDAHKKHIECKLVIRKNIIKQYFVDIWLELMYRLAESYKRAESEFNYKNKCYGRK